MGPSSIEFVIKAPEAVIRQFVSDAVVSERSRAQGILGYFSRLEGS